MGAVRDRRVYILKWGGRAKRVLGVALTATLLAGTLVATAAPALAADVDVSITEIMYDPPSDLDADEFVEIHNSGNDTVDLTGWCVGGIGFCFAPGTSIGPGEYMVLSPDAARTLAVYGVVVADTYTGRLKNGGETVELLDAGNVVVHSLDYDDAHPWPVTPDGQGPSLELISLDADQSNPWNWAAATNAAGHTAGGPNSVAANGTPPEFGTVTNSTTTPVPGQAITVTAEITGSTTTPVLSWRTDLGSFSNIAMSDQGGNVWKATIPGQTAGELVDYRILTTGPFDHTFPRVDAGSTTFGIFYQRAVASNIPVFEWFIADEDYQSMITDHLEDDKFFPMALVVGDEVITGAQVRVRGSSSVFDDKVNFKFEMPRGHDLVLDGLLIEPVDEFAVQAEFSDRSYGRSILTWSAYEAAGIPVPQVFKIRVERNGEFQGLNNYMNTFDRTWREREGFQDDGALYKAKTGAFSVNRSIAKRWDQKSGVDDGLASLEEMIDFIQDPDADVREAYVREHFDVSEIINYSAVTALAQHIDSSSKNFYVFQSYVTGRWSIIPWDLDHTLGNDCSCNVFSDFVTPAEPGDKVNEMIAAVLEIDEFEDMYFRRVRSLLDELLAPGLLENVFDTKIGPANAEAALDKAKWGQCCTVPLERQWLFEDIQDRRDLFEAEPRVPGTQATAPTVEITEIFADGDQSDVEFVELYNPSTTTAVDVSGWALSNAIDLTIANGAVIGPETPMVFVAADAAFGLEHGRTLFVGGTYEGDLIASGEIVTLARSDGSVADVVDYSDLSFPTPPMGSSIELDGSGLDNADGANWSVNAGATPDLFAGNGGVPIVPNPPLVPFPPIESPSPYRCTATPMGGDMQLAFSGTRGSSENLRFAGGSWIATVTNDLTHTVTGGAGGSYEVRVTGDGFDSPYSTVDCIAAGGPPPDPTLFTCTATSVGADTLLTFDGLRGSSENLRLAGGSWVASMTGLTAFTHAGGAGDSYVVRVRGDGFDDPFSTIVCN